MKVRAKQRMKRRRDRFVVGYLGAKNLVFCSTSDWEHHVRVGDRNAGDPMTLRNATKLLASMPCADCAIFELVPVEVNR